MDEYLIEYVRQHEVLYNHSSAEYRDQRIRQEAWEEIGSHLKITADNAKRKWDKLRRCFCNARNRRLCIKSGPRASKNIPKWRFEQQMAFLLPYLEGRKYFHNSQNNHEIYVSDEEVNNEDNDDADQQEEVLEGHADATEDKTDEEDQKYSAVTQNSQDEILTGTENTKTLEYIKRSKKCLYGSKNSAEKMVTIMKQNAALRKRKFEDKEIAQKKKEDMDDIDMFFLSLAKMTKRLPQVEQTSVKIKVSNAILDAELRHAQAQQSTHT